MSNETPEAKPETIAKYEPQDIFSVFDGLDDKAITDEIEGRLSEMAVYHFNQDGKELWGIGKVGVDICVTEMAKKGIAVRDDDVEWTLDPTDPEYLFFKAKVHKHYVGKDGKEAEVDTAIGVKRQWTKFQKRDGSVVADKFFFEKGAQKAIRNARLRLIPEEIKAQVIAFAKEKGKVKDVGYKDFPVSPRPAAKASRPTSPPPPPPPPPPNDFLEGEELGDANDEKRAKKVFVTLTLTDGKPRNVELSKAYGYFGKMKAQLTPETYYGILGAYGYEHANQIKPYYKLDDIYQVMVNKFKDLDAGRA